MGYNGEHLSRCPERAFEFTHDASIVVVTGDGPNFCGHGLLNTNNCGGWYFHVTGEVYTQPWFMDAQGYGRYMRENGKQEIRRIPLLIKEPKKAREKLMDLLSQKWLWMGIPHNCVTFVETVASAGGSAFELRWNCPGPETKHWQR
jgi:hypothetical protein